METALYGSVWWQLCDYCDYVPACLSMRAVGKWRKGETGTIQ